MDRRKFVTGSAAVIGAASLPRTYAQAQAAPDKIRVGYAISISGPLGAGAENTAITQYKLWHKRVNDAGGIMLKKFNKKVPVEMIAYDDRGQPDELIKLTERLILQDKVDLLLSPYATHLNLAAAPIVNKYEYPVIFTTAGSARIYQLAKEWSYAFWSIAQPNEATAPLVEMCAALKKDGKIKGRVAAVHVGQQSMVEMHAAFVDAAKKAGLEVVFNKNYPFGASDLQPLIREVMASDPEAFIAFSYPADTFLLVEQAQTVGFNPQVFYAAIGSAFPTFKVKFGKNVDGILTYDGMDRSAPGLDDYNKAHEAMFNRVSQVSAVGVYACLQVLQAAVEAAGEIDRKKIRDEIAKGPFQTIWGEIQFKDQRNTSPWAVGQWQDADVVGIYPASKKGAKPLLFPKPKWT
jgi:branched-chain amino acid transport system substrate-binding protein